MRISAAISHLFPVVVLVVFPYFAWVLLALLALTAQWTVEPRHAVPQML